MRAIYDLDQTVIRMVPKWLKLMFQQEELAVKMLAKLPNYKEIADDVDYAVSDYKMDRYFGLSDAEKKLMYDCYENSSDFYDEFENMTMPDFGIKNIEEIVIISDCKKIVTVSLSKKALLESWKRQGKITDYVLTQDNKAEFIINSKYKHYDLLAEDHTEYPIKICEILDKMKIHLVPYPYNALTLWHLASHYSNRLI